VRRVGKALDALEVGNVVAVGLGEVGAEVGIALSPDDQCPCGNPTKLCCGFLLGLPYSGAVAVRRASASRSYEGLPMQLTPMSVDYRLQARFRASRERHEAARRSLPERWRSDPRPEAQETNELWVNVVARAREHEDRLGQLLLENVRPLAP
jgi:hypothetical protein